MSDVNKILEEARRRAKEIVDSAKREAETIIREAERRWLQRADIERGKIIDVARREASLIISEAKRVASFTISKAKETAIKEVFDRAWEIIERDQYDVKSSLRSLFLESISFASDPQKVLSNPRHVDLVREVLRELGYDNVEVEPSPVVRGGILVIAKDGTIIDNRLETRLEQAKLRLVDRVARLLWG